MRDDDRVKVRIDERVSVFTHCLVILICNITVHVRPIIACIIARASTMAGIERRSAYYSRATSISELRYLVVYAWSSNHSSSVIVPLIGSSPPSSTTNSSPFNLM